MTRAWGRPDRADAPVFTFPRLDPEQTRRSILAYLAGRAPNTASRGEIHRDLYGLDLKVAQSVASAIGSLLTLKLIEKRYGRYVVTDAGLAALELDDEMRSAS